MVEFVDDLSYRSVRDYHWSPIPVADDERLRRFVIECVKLPPNAFPSLADDLSWRLLTFAGRAATLAVRESSLDWIRDGLAALMIEGGRADLSVSLERAALLYDAAIRAGATATVLFDEAAALNPATQFAQDLRDFCRRPREEITLEAWRYRITSDAGQFSYKRTW